jgi:hypothetical protein
MRTLITLAAVALLAGCASSGRIDPGYAGYLQAEDRKEARQAERIAAIADGSTCNGDANCVMQRAAYAAIVEAAALGGSSGQGIAPPPRKLEWSEHIRNISPLTGQLLSSFDNYTSNRFNRDNIRSNNELQLGIFDRLAGGWERTNTAAFDAFRMQPPTTQVNGDLISGTQTIVGGDLLGAGARVGDNTAIDIGDINTGTQIDNAGNFGDGNRQDSPDDRSQRTECEGDGCMGVNRPITNLPPNADPAE